MPNARDILNTSDLLSLVELLRKMTEGTNDPQVRNLYTDVNELYTKVESIVRDLAVLQSDVTHNREILKERITTALENSNEVEAQIAAMQSAITARIDELAKEVVQLQKDTEKTNTFTSTQRKIVMALYCSIAAGIGSLIINWLTDGAVMHILKKTAEQ